MPPRKPQKPPQRERLKVAAVVVLAVVLAAILLSPASDAPPADDAETGRRQLPGGRVAANSPGEPATATVPAASGASTAAGDSIAQLPRIDVDRIAASDPFVARRRIVDPVAAPFADPEAAFRSAPLMTRREIRAVYRNARGAVAIVDDQIIPIDDAKKWIERMRSADADP